MKYEDRIRAETVCELSNELIKTTIDVMKKHGFEDPNNNAIISAGFYMAIKDIGKELDPNIPIIIKGMI